MPERSHRPVRHFQLSAVATSKVEHICGPNRRMLQTEDRTVSAGRRGWEARIRMRPSSWSYFRHAQWRFVCADLEFILCTFLAPKQLQYRGHLASQSRTRALVRTFANPVNTGQTPALEHPRSPTIRLVTRGMGSVVDTADAHRPFYGLKPVVKPPCR